MSQLRLNIATGDWVVVAPERARRPEEFHTGKALFTHDRPADREDCPFCPGQERDTPDESLCYRDQAGLWQVRCFPNRYPALSPGEKPTRHQDSIHRWMEGIGCHDVVCESRLHNTTLALQSEAEVASVLRAWQQRYCMLLEQPETEHVIVFKNHGGGAGTSLEHPHSQIVSLPMVPGQVLARLEHSTRYYNFHGRCVFCLMLEQELAEARRMAAESAHFGAFVPYAAFSPCSLWILPKRHQVCFSLASRAELDDLARLLRDLLRRFYFGLGDPDYNLVLRTSHPQTLGSRYFHWYLALVPRLSRLAGFEMGSGMFINASVPEADAEFLRQIQEPFSPTG